VQERQAQLFFSIFKGMTNIKHSMPWLKDSCDQLDNFIAQNRIPQALLLTGAYGLGQYSLADHFTQSLVCVSRSATGSYCGQCKSCLLFQSGCHPDYILIEPEQTGKMIGIEVIRQLLERLTLKPQFQNQRVVVIRSAEQLNHAAANAFLKYLEEPTERTSLILITEKSLRLPATIRSRCQKMTLTKPKREESKRWLQQTGVTEQIDLLLNLSDDSPLFAKQLFETTLLLQRKDWFKGWIRVLNSPHHLIDTAEQWYKLDPSEISLLMSWLISWITDIVKLARENEDLRLTNTDFRTDLQDCAKKLDLRDLFKYYDYLLACQSQLNSQLNKQLMFEEILIKWSELKLK